MLGVFNKFHIKSISIKEKKEVFLLGKIKKDK